MSAKPIEVSVRGVLQEVANAIPEDVRPNIIVIGSLAAGYGVFGSDDWVTVRTKDVDCVLSPQPYGRRKRPEGCGKADRGRMETQVGRRI